MITKKVTRHPTSGRTVVSVTIKEDGLTSTFHLQSGAGAVADTLKVATKYALDNLDALRH